MQGLWTAGDSLGRFTTRALSVAAFLFASSSVLADLPVAMVNEAHLPYDLSPSNYDNSPSNYDNSISNYDNSASNYENSESNYDNSTSNYDNGSNGSRRLIYKQLGTPKFAGYYVAAGSGTTNFFSTRGRRLFYNPKKESGIFSGNDGDFCGVLTTVNGVLSLALTERGAKILLLAD